MIRTTLRRLLGAALLLAATSAANAAQPGDPVHLGVGTCANSTCHGAAMPSPGSMVTQREFMVWRDYDRHSKAYTALLGERAKAIAGHLGIAAAEKAPACLACHSDNVPVALRGKNFRVEDGVGCETCHGGSANWLGVHAIGDSTHAENVAAGMYPTDDPSARAKLCLGCHLFRGGDDLQHRYYAAGHPRLKFELDTYTEERPGHHQIDADYRRRKPGSYGARAWLLGQAAAARKLVQRLDETAGRQAWPDLAVFACYGCHRKPGSGQDDPSGYPVFQDAPVQMLDVALGALQLDGAPLHGALQKLHVAVGGGRIADWKSAAQRLDAALADAERALRARAEQPDDAQRLLQALLQRAITGDFARQHLAEQASYAMATLRLASPPLAARNAPQAEAALDHLFSAAGQTAGFDSAQWITAAVELGTAFKSGNE